MVYFWLIEEKARVAPCASVITDGLKGERLLRGTENTPMLTRMFAI